MHKAKVAIVAEWLTSRGGAEIVVDELIKIFPDAQIFTTVFNPEVFPELKGKKPITSFLQKIPILSKHHQKLGALMPKAIESLNLKGYDIIISSSSAFGKGIIRPKGSVHVCYCHTPMRYVWQSDIDRRLSRLPFSRMIIKILKKWDLKSNKTVDYFLANSKYAAARIKKYYNREAQVVYPPVAKEQKLSPVVKGDYYLAISRLVEYKRFDLAIKACQDLGKNLIIAGSGPEQSNWMKLAGQSTTFVGRVDDQKKTGLIAKAKGLIFPAEEDFGIVPIEAMSHLTPVIGLKRGGTRETVIDGKTGVLFEKQTVEDLKQAIQRFEKLKFKDEDLLTQANRFSVKEFDQKIISLIDKIKKEKKWI